MAVGDWIKVRNQIAVEICSDGQVFVEGFLHNLARFLARDSTVEAMNYERKLGPRPRDKDGYAVWEFIGTDRRTRSSNFLWNDSCPAKDYAKIAEKWGLKYSEEDFKKADLGNGPQPKIEQAPAANGPSAISMPPMGRKAWNLATSLMNFVADGLKTVSTEQYQERLDVCDSCENRSGNRCTKCGCHLSIKAKGRAFDCPIGKWPVIPSS